MYLIWLFDLGSLLFGILGEICACTLRDKENDEFIMLKQGNMLVTSYKAKFHDLARFIAPVDYYGGEDPFVCKGIEYWPSGFCKLDDILR